MTVTQKRVTALWDERGGPFYDIGRRRPHAGWDAA